MTVVNCVKLQQKFVTLAVQNKTAKNGNTLLHKIRNVQYLSYYNVSASIAYYVSETTLDFSIEYISFVFCVDKEQFYSDKAEGFSDKVHRSRGAVFGKTAQIFSVSLSSPI